MPPSLTNPHRVTIFPPTTLYPSHLPLHALVDIHLPTYCPSHTDSRMQPLPFDDAEFPPPGSTVTSTWDQSPRVPIVPQTTNQPPTVTDEELYRLVGAPPPSPQDDLIRYSQQMPLTAQHLHNFPQPSQPQQTHSRQRQDLHYRSIPHPPLPHLPPASRMPVSAAAIHQTASAQVANPPRTRRRSSTTRSQQQQQQQQQSQLDASRTGATQSPLQMRGVRNDGSASVQMQAQAQLSRQTGVIPGMALSASEAGTLTGKESGKRPKRSAVEEARIRAQREAESFANSRRDSTKREASLHSTGKSGEGTAGEGSSSMRQSSKRMRVDPEPNSSNEYQTSRKKTGSGDEGGTKEEESEVEKKERYKRRLDMNRESAAVSRVRRRAYVKELEERLAAVEAEKLQLEGKLEIMMSQNESLKKQFENLFLMVASGRRPTYPGQVSGENLGNNGTQGGGGGSGTGG